MSKETDLIVEKLQAMLSMVGELTGLYEAAKVGDEYYGNQISTLKGLGMMIELSYDSVQSHEAFTKSINESKARIAKIDEAIAANKASNSITTQEMINRVLAEAQEVIEGPKKNKLQ